MHGPLEGQCSSDRGRSFSKILPFVRKFAVNCLADTLLACRDLSKSHRAGTSAYSTGPLLLPYGWCLRLVPACQETSCRQRTLHSTCTRPFVSQ